jgi:ABC-type proline/glycine betaine transport system ATPase subunit
LINIYSDVESGGRADRKGLARALEENADLFECLSTGHPNSSVMK